MAWNEPGGKGPRDPWGGGNRNDGPPDLDEALKKFQEKINGLFGGGKGGAPSGASFSIAIVPLLIILAFIWAVLGIYQVDTKEQAVILRLGKYHDTVGEGLHWRPPLIDSKSVVEVTTVRQYRTTGLMLTGDTNIVQLPLTVQWQVADAKSFVLNVKDPENSLHNATDSALRHVIGSSTLNQVISEGRGKIAAEVQTRLQNLLNDYGTGIQVMKVNIQEGRPPSQVKAAFDDVIKAREDESRYVNEAQAYANEIIPVARGKAQRMLEEAEAYRAEVEAKAVGEAQRFEKLLTEYKKAPEVTRERLYLDAVESVMSSASKILMDVEGTSNMMYLPLDKLVQGGGSSRAAVTNEGVSPDVIREISDAVVERLRREAGSARRNVREVR